MTLSQHTTQGDCVKLLKKIILWLFSKTITIHLMSRAVKGHRVQLLCANCWGPGVPSSFTHLILLSFSSPRAPISYFYLPHSLTLSFFCSSAFSKKTPLQTVSCLGSNISLSVWNRNLELPGCSAPYLAICHIQAGGSQVTLGFWV